MAAVASTESEIDRKLTLTAIINNDTLLKAVPEIQNLVLKHLPTVDSQRLVRIIDNLVTKVMLIASFPRILENLEEFSLLIGRRAVKLFEQYGEAIKNFNSSSAKIEACSQSVSDSELFTQFPSSTIWEDAFSQDSDPLGGGKVKNMETRRLVHVLRELINELMIDPLVVASLVDHKENWAIEWSQASQILADLLTQLRHLAGNDLLTTPKAKAKREDFLDALKKRDEEQTTGIAELKKRYNQLQQMQNDQIHKRLGLFRRLFEQIMDTQRNTCHELKVVKSQYDTEARLTQEKHDETIQSLRAYEETVTEQLEALTLSSTKRIQKLITEKWRAEGVITDKVSRMDTEMFQLQEEYEEIKKLDDQEVAEIEVLRADLEPLQAAAEVILEYKRQASERMAEQLRLQQEQIQSATDIQSLWRSWTTRRRLRAERRRMPRV